jgi:hypothetical protein
VRFPIKTAVPVLAVGLSALLVGCGNSSPKASSTASSTPKASSTSSPGSSSMTGTAGTIAANWETFFSAKTPNAKRITLLEDGTQFTKVISEQSGSSLASTASAKVSGVTAITSSTATVAYSIDIGGTPALANQTGQAVYQDGTWKVGDKSFCSLIALELGKSGLPAACSAS